MQRSIGSTGQQCDDGTASIVVVDEGLEEIGVLDRSQVATRGGLDRQGLADVRHVDTIIPLLTGAEMREWGTCRC